MPKLSKICRDERRDRYAGLRDPAADVERARRDRAVAESAGVRRDREKEMRRDLWRPRHAERVDHVGHHLSARGRGRVEPVDLTVHLIAEVMVDVDGEVALETADLRPAQVAALEHDHGIGRDVRGGDDLELLDAGEARIRRRRGIMVEQAHRLAQALEGERERELRADRVAVRPRVRGQNERLAIREGPRDVLRIPVQD